jgi:hypothetical protein
MAVTVTVSIMGGCIYRQKQVRGGKPGDIFIKYINEGERSRTTVPAPAPRMK